MKRNGKSVFFIVAILLVAFTAVTFLGISTQWGDTKTVYIKGADDIRWGIDIRGGVDVTFAPPADTEGITNEQMDAAEAIIKQRLISQNITDSDVYTDYSKHKVIVRFPWPADETDFDAQAAIASLGETAQLTFREGKEVDTSTGLPTGTTESNVILTGSDVVSAKAGYQQTDKNKTPEYVVSLELTSEGATKFSEATGRLAGTGSISIWMDDTMISAPTVNTQITDGKAIISGSFNAETATDLANKINGGALPFKLETTSYSTISPTLGTQARDAMVVAGLIAFALVCVFMIALYRLPGAVACIALMGQIALSVAAVSGFFAPFPSFTLTLPGIAGIILGIGMGVDANILTATRIREELDNGKSLDGAITTGYKRGFTAVFDGNITVILIAVVLMGAFGPPDSIFATILKPIFFMFGSATEGTIYSFGYTLIVGIIGNFIMGVTASRVMLRSLSKFKCFRNPKLYGGAK